MTTSGITTWSLTVSQICKAAALELGYVGIDEELSGGELDAFLTPLNGLLKSWSKKGNLFRESSSTVTITANTASVALTSGTGSPVLVGVGEVISAWVVESATNERLLASWSRTDYLRIPNKVASGSPTAYYVGRTIAGKTLYVWPVPTANTSIKIDYTRLAETVTAGGETLDIVDEWHEAVIKNLAARCANLTGTVRSDPTTVQKIMAEAKELETQFFDADRPDYYVFESGLHY